MFRTDLFHLSFDGNLPKTLYPRQPYGYEAESQHGERLPDRVSFAPTIDGCWAGIYANIAKYAIQAGNNKLEFYLYKGLPDEETQQISHEDKLKEIWDYPLTNEICVTTPIKVWKYAKVAIKVRWEEEYAMRCSALKRNGKWSNPVTVAPGITWEIIEKYEFPEPEHIVDDGVLKLVENIKFE